MRKLVIILLVTISAITSCSEYQKLLKSTDAELKYSRAIEYYKSGDYNKALTLFEGLMSIYKGTTKAEEVFYYYSYCQYALEDFILAGYYFDNFAKTFPNSKHAQECQFLSAYCNYKQSPRVTLDQSSTIDAIAKFELFISMYPGSPRIEECNKLIDELRGKLEEKSYLNARLYYDLSMYKAARVALKNSLDHFPDSKYREELLFLIIKSDYLYASNSVEKKKKERFEETLKDYSVFNDEFPQSKYKRELDKIYSTSMKFLEQN